MKWAAKIATYLLVLAGVAAAVDYAIRDQCEMEGTVTGRMMPLYIAAVKQYRTENGQYPKELSDLIRRPKHLDETTWRPMLESIENDPWGSPYRLHVDIGNERIVLICDGPDKLPYTDDDIVRLD